MTQTVQNRIKLARNLAIATLSFGVLFYAIGAAVKPGYSHFSNFISELNATGTPWAVQLGLAGFVPLGLLFGAFLVVVAPIAQVRGPSRLGLWLLWSQPIAFIGVAIAPCDAGCPIGGSPLQAAHDILGLATYFPCALAFMLLSFAPNLSSGWRLFFRVAGVAWLILFVAMLQPVAMHVRGLLQRSADALLAASVLVIAWRMVGNTLATPNNHSSRTRFADRLDSGVRPLMNSANPRLEIDDITAQLMAREPLFHRTEFGTTRQDFDRMMAEEFWEIGASGQIYSRAFVLDTLERRHSEPVEEDLEVTDFRCQALAANLFLASYTLNQSGRVSRRASIWRHMTQGWQVVYHQGTIVADRP